MKPKSTQRAKHGHKHKEQNGKSEAVNLRYGSGIVSICGVSGIGLDVSTDTQISPKKGRVKNFEEQEYEAFQRVRRELLRDVPYLIVIDNLESELDWWDGRDILDLLPRINGATHVIITTRLSQESEGRMQRVVVKALREIFICTQSNQVILARSGGVETIMHLMASSSDDIKKYVAEILSAMTRLKEVRRAIVGMHGLPMLIQSARLGRIASRARAAQAIGLLGVIRRTRRMLVNAGAIPALIELLREGDIAAKLVFGNALGIISAHVDYLWPVAQAGAIPLFAELLEGNDPQEKEIS